MRRTIEDRNRLNGAVAHDLRSPLTTILDYTELLLDDDNGPLRSEVPGSLKRIPASTSDAVRAIDTLTAQATAGSLRIAPNRRAANIRLLSRETPRARDGR